MTRLAVAAASYTLAADPDAVQSGRRTLKVAVGAASTLLYPPISGVVSGSTVATATLRLYRKGTAAITPTVVAQLADATWAPSTLDWNNSPGPTGTATTVTQASSADADEYAFTFTTQVNAARASGEYFGVILTGTGDPVDFYGPDSAFPPTIELSVTSTPPDPANLRPSAGRAVATSKPTIVFDAPDVTYVRVEVDADGSWSGIGFFDSGFVAATTGRLDLSTTAFSGLLAGVDTQYRVQYKNSSGIISAWSSATHMMFKVKGALTITYPTSIISTDTPVVTWTLTGSGITQTAYRVVVTLASDPSVVRHDSGLRVGTATSYTLPDMVVRDSADYVVTVSLLDNQTREAIPGYGLETTASQTFSFQGVQGVPPPDSLFVTQQGTSPVVDIQWLYTDKTADAWNIRVDNLTIAGSAETAGLKPDADGIYHWLYYVMSPGDVHQVEVAAKVGGNVSANNPQVSTITFVEGKWLLDPNTGGVVALWGLDSDSGNLTDTVAVYNPLRGQNAVPVTQGQRGYEDTLTGYVIDDAATLTARQAYKVLTAMRATPDPEKNYIVVYPYMAFEAKLSGWKLPNTDRPGAARWDVAVNYLQQGDLLWIGREPISPQLKLRHVLDFEGWGASGATITTGMSGALNRVQGAPTLQTAAADHSSTLGMRVPNAAGGGWIKTDCAYIATGQVYIKPHTVSAKNPFLFVDANSTPGYTCYSLMLRTAKDISIEDHDGNTVDKTSIPRSWDVDKWTRIDWQHTWFPDTLTIYVQVSIFFDTNVDGTVPDDFIFGTMSSTLAPLYPAFGNGQAGIQVDYDDITIWDGNAVAPPPKDPGGNQGVGSSVYALAGEQTDTSFRVKALVTGLDDTSTVQVGVGTSLDGSGFPASPTYVSPDETIDCGTLGTLMAFTVTGRTAATQYYTQLVSAPASFIGSEVTKVKTDPATASFSGTQVLKVALGSCQSNARGSQAVLAWDDMRSWAPDWLIHTGDFHYQGQKFTPASTWLDHLAIYVDQMVSIPSMRQTLQSCAGYYEADDHEISGNNGDSNLSTDTGKVRQQSIQGMQRFLPQMTSEAAGTRDNKHSLFWQKWFGPRVRFLFLDNESLDRSVQADTDNSAKTFLGAEQDAWLKARLVEPAVVNILICGKGLLGTKRDDTTRDKPNNYQTWRTGFKNWINANTTTGGLPIKVYWWGGDIHANVYVSATNNPVWPGPAAAASGYEMHSKAQDTGEDYDSTNGYSPVIGGNKKEVTRLQYMQWTITDAPSGGGHGTVTIAGKSRWAGTTTYNGTTGAQTNPSTWVLADGFTCSDSWTY